MVTGPTKIKVMSKRSLEKTIWIVNKTGNVAMTEEPLAYHFKGDETWVMLRFENADLRHKCYVCLTAD
jgi:hypothetical protein